MACSKSGAVWASRKPSTPIIDRLSSNALCNVRTLGTLVPTSWRMLRSVAYLAHRLVPCNVDHHERHIILGRQRTQKCVDIVQHGVSRILRGQAVCPGDRRDETFFAVFLAVFVHGLGNT